MPPEYQTDLDSFFRKIPTIAPRKHTLMPGDAFGSIASVATKETRRFHRKKEVRRREIQINAQTDVNFALIPTQQPILVGD